MCADQRKPPPMAAAAAEVPAHATSGSSLGPSEIDPAEITLVHAIADGLLFLKRKKKSVFI